MERESSILNQYQFPQSIEHSDSDTESSPEINQLRIGLDVPLAMRIAHINPIEIGVEWKSAGQISEALNANERRIYRIINDIGIESESRVINSLEMSVYPPFTVPVLHEEIAWRDSYSVLPSYVRVSHIAAYFGRSVGSTRKRLNQSGIEPRIVEPKQGKPYELFHKSAIRIFREEDMMVPPSHDWLSLGQLQDYLSCDRQWILNRIAEASIEPQTRRAALSGKIIDHYPPSSLDMLQMAIEARPSPGATWLTSEAIQKEIGRSLSWVTRRLQQFNEVSEVREDDNGRSRIHYPPSVLTQLQAESDRQQSLGTKEDGLSLKEVARSLGHASIWALKRLESLDITPEETVDKVGRVQLTYTSDVIEKLRMYDA